MRRVRFGSTTDGTLDALDGQIDTGNENGNNPDNDLVIRDSNGTIVMRYDESAGAWALANNDLTGVGALDTESVSIGDLLNADLSVGSTDVIYQIPLASGDCIVSGQQTQGVADTAVSIWDSADTPQGGSHNAVCKVFGNEQGNVSTNFYDKVTWNRNGSPVVDPGETNENGTPADRSYGPTAADSSLNLTMSEATDYDVIVIAEQGRAQS